MGRPFLWSWGASQAARAEPDVPAEGSPANLKIRILDDVQCQPKTYKCKALLSRRQVHPLDHDLFFWKLSDFDFPLKIKHSTIDKTHETKSHTLYVIPQPWLFEVCVRVFVFFVFFWFFAFSCFFSFSLMCAILVIIKEKDEARIEKAFAKVFISNSLCCCELLVFGPHW